MDEKSQVHDTWQAGVRAGGRVDGGISLSGQWSVSCVRDGVEIWREEIHNLVVDTGLNDVLDKYFKGSNYSAAHYVGLADGTPTPAAGDTMASHAGWAEVTAYDEGTRPAFTPGTVSAKSVSNSASKAEFTISGAATIGGAFLTTNNTKGGSTGTLVSVAAFTSGDRSLQDGDVIQVQVTYTGADDGV